MLIIRGPIKPYIFWIKIILAIFLAKTRPHKTIICMYSIHTCLLWGKVRTLLEWADSRLSKKWSGWSGVHGFYTIMTTKAPAVLKKYHLFHIHHTAFEITQNISQTSPWHNVRGCSFLFFVTDTFFSSHLTFLMIRLQVIKESWFEDSSVISSMVFSPSPWHSLQKGFWSFTFPPFHLQL